MRKFFAGLLILLVLIIVSGGLYLYSFKPDYGGEVILKGLNSEVDIIYDQYGVPHIYATNEEDAYYALGYVHAKERLFQMEMIRRVATGSLSEIAGSEFIRVDKFFRTLGMEKIADQSEAIDFNEDNAIARSADAYTRGINAFISENDKPIEFVLMGIPLRPFERKDIYYTAGYLALGFAEGFRTDPLLTYIETKYGKDYLYSFSIDSRNESEYLGVFPQEESLALISEEMHDVFDQIPIPLFHGSNSWIVGPEKTDSDYPILTNDTHIGYSQPAVWFEAHLEYPGMSLYGHFAAGFPFAILGHTPNTAWGMTMFENDDADFYVMETHPDDSTRVLIDSVWVESESRYDTITVKDNDKVIFAIAETPWGPIINNSLEAFPSTVKQPVAAHWTFLQSPSPLLNATYNLSAAKNVYEIGEAASLVKAPGLNIMAADTEGNYGWFAAAMLNKRDGISNSKVFLNANSHSPQGYYDNSYNPKAVNTPWNYVYSANNQPDTTRGIFHAGYYMPEDRAIEIRTFLDSKDKFSFEELRDFQLHSTSSKSAEVAKLILDIYRNVQLTGEETDMLALLNDWNGTQDRNSLASTVYYTLLSEIYHHSMADELGRKKLDMMSQLAVFKRSHLRFLRESSNPWWDNTKTEKIEKRSDILSEAISHAYEKLSENLGDNMDQWQWKKIHKLTHPHILGSVDLLAPYFNVGPFEVDGGVETVNNSMMALTHGPRLDARAGAAMRRVIDMGNVAGANGILPTGQSGHFLSPHYDDQAQMYANGEFRILMTREEDIFKLEKNHLTLLPDGR